MIQPKPGKFEARAEKEWFVGLQKNTNKNYLIYHPHWTLSQGWKWTESITPHASFNEDVMFGDTLNKLDKQKAASYWASINDEYIREMNFDEFPSPQISQTNPGFGGELFSSQKENHQNIQTCSSPIASIPISQPKVTPRCEESKYEFQDTKHRTSVPLDSASEKELPISTLRRQEIANKESNAPPDAPESENKSEDLPSNPYIPDETWSYSHDMIIRQSSPADSSVSESESSVTTSSPQNDS